MNSNKKVDASELYISCMLQAVNVPDIGPDVGFWAHLQLQKDPTNALGQTAYMINANPTISIQSTAPNSTSAANAPTSSSLLRNVPQANGGFALPPNPRLGAPLATFAYGGILPNTPHPQFPLIVGPDTTNNARVFDGNKLNVLYNPQPIVGNAATGNTLGTWTGSQYIPPQKLDKSQFSPYFGGIVYPYIPSVLTSQITSLMTPTPLVTYNIWQMIGLESALFDAGLTLGYLGNSGPILPSGFGGAKYRQVGAPDGTCRLLINASNTICQMMRIFPIAYDLAYNDTDYGKQPPILYYPSPLQESGGSNSSSSGGSSYGDQNCIGARCINATGGANCGFQIHFSYSKPGVNGSIAIMFGNIINQWLNNPSPQSDTISSKLYAIDTFSIVLSPGKLPSMSFLHPKNNVWVTQNIKGPVVPNYAADYSVYVHFVGPNMIIGFGGGHGAHAEDIEEWNCLVPFEDIDNYTSCYEYYIPARSSISVIFSDIVSTLQYGPMAFNNYETAYVQKQFIEVTSSNIENYSNTSDLSFINLSFTAPNTSIATGPNGTITQDNINYDLQMHAFRSEIFDPCANFRSVATYYPDWRRERNRRIDLQYQSSDINPNSLYMCDLAYLQTTPPALYNNSNPNDNTVIAYGQVIFNTTIEGPLFLHCKSAPTIAQTAQTILQTLSWGDITPYFTDAEISYNSTLKNGSRLTSNANIKLSNMVSTKDGRDLLTLLEENMLAVSISAGYTADQQTFFQGFVDSQQTTRNPDGSSITTLQCTDLITMLLGQTIFTTAYFWGYKPYGNIIAKTIAAAGLQSEYFQDYQSLINFANYETMDTKSVAVGKTNSGVQEYLSGLNFRYVNFSYNHSVAAKGIHSNMFDMILPTTETFLGLMTGLSANATNTSVDYIEPTVLWWDPNNITNPNNAPDAPSSSQHIRLSRRRDYLDHLYFIGQPDATSGALYFPQSASSVHSSDDTNNMHGVLISSYTTTTINSHLTMSATILGQQVNTTNSLQQSVRNDTAYGDNALTQLQNAITSTGFNCPTPLGYIGFRKSVVDTPKNAIEIPDQASLQNRLNQYKGLLNHTYQSIEFDVYVTKPLYHCGVFTINTFDNINQTTSNSTPTDQYFYKKVVYRIDRNNSIITARITGEKFPPILLSPGTSTIMLPESIVAAR